MVIRWHLEKLPQDAYDTLCREEEDTIDVKECAFYKVQNVKVIPPGRPVITEI